MVHADGKDAARTSLDVKEGVAMYASARRYKMGAGALDSLTHRVDAELAPARGRARLRSM